jgi:hypothetical protein
MKRFERPFVAVLLFAVVPAVVIGQTKRNARPKNRATTTATPRPTPSAVPSKTPEPVKRNERPDNGAVSGQPLAAGPPNYFYQFERPGFTFPSISIEHDEAGRGQITFVKEGNDVAICDPVELSPATLARLKESFAALNFLDSDETYQTPRDHSTMGNVTITLKQNDRSRTVHYNWSENKNAKALADEYRRISNEYIWRFEITSARENQPLLAPKLMQQMEDYLRRGEISDAAELVPFLLELSNDERIPLIARDKAAKFADQIQRSKK